MARSNGHDLTLNSSRAGSPDDNIAFTTGMSFLHSTPQRSPSHYDQFHGYNEPSIHNSDQEQQHSMSIEMGRGVKRGARHDLEEDLSSNAPLSFGNDDSMYEVVDTPPRRPQTTLRKEAAVRRATDTARANDALKRSSNSVKPRAVSDNVQQQQNLGSPQHTATVNAFDVRGSRFTGSRQVSAHVTSVPTRFTAQRGLEYSNQTATAISATYNTSQTNQSFLLPDLPNINELVLGVRKDGTPAAKRTSRSRFTSASYKPQTLSHIPVKGVAVPDDEKAIYASLQMLKDRLTQLEMENSEAHRRAEQYEAEAINLRSQADVGTRRPDSGLGSDDDDDTIAPNKSKLQASVQALQHHVSRYERKLGVSEAAIGRITKERDSLITQIGQAYLKQEELAEENEAYRETQANLVSENEELREQVRELKHENMDVRGQLERIKNLQGHETGGLRRKTSTKANSLRKTDHDEMDDIASGPWNFTENKSRAEASVRSRKEEHIVPDTMRPKTNKPLGDASARDIASRIEREIQKLREDREQMQRSGKVRSRSGSQRCRSTNNTEQVTSKTPRRKFSAPADASASAAELTATEKDATVSHHNRGNVRVAREAQIEEDLTVLSELDPNLAANLRKKFEDERRSKRAQQDQAKTIEPDITGRSTTRHSLPRKSSMKDVTSGAEEGTGRLSIAGKTIEDMIKTAKTVRVQSPHSSDTILQPLQPEITEIEDASMLSNTSRRRRRTGSSECMTSAFIIPDITIHATQPLDLGKNCIHHDATRCTACVSIGERLEIPEPVPVTDRELEDVTNATIRPAQPPAKALATVIKNLEDEITHLKMQREIQNQAYNQHDPALSRHRRLAVKAELGRLIDLIDKRSDQVYALYDVLEGQKQQKENASQEIDESIEIGRGAPVDRVDQDDLSGVESDELPWEGLSETESDH